MNNNMDFKMINVVGAKAVALQEQVKLLCSTFGFNVTLTGEETYKQLQETVTKLQEEAKAKMGTTGGSNTPAAPKADKANAVYVWLKNPAYVDKNGTQRIAGGFYHIDLAQFPRLEKLGAPTCYIFNDVPTRKLVDIAKWFGMNPEKYKTDEALLAALVKEPTLY